MASSNQEVTSDPPPRESAGASSPLLKGKSKTNGREESVCTIRSSTCLRLSAFIFSVISLTCFTATRNYNETVVSIALWLSLIGHVGGAVYSIFTSLVHFEWKPHRGWTTERKNHSTSVGGLRITIKVTRALLVWDLTVGVAIVVGFIICSFGWMTDEAIAAVVFAGLTAAIHFLLAIPQTKSYPINIAWASATDEQAFDEEEGPNPSPFSDLESSEEAQ